MSVLYYSTNILLVPTVRDMGTMRVQYVFGAMPFAPGEKQKPEAIVGR